MSYSADVVFPDYKITSLLDLSSNSDLKKRFGGDELKQIFNTGYLQELKGEAVKTYDENDKEQWFIRCDSEERPEFWFETSKTFATQSRGRLSNAVVPSVSEQKNAYLRLFGLCGSIRPMPLLKKENIAKECLVSKGFSRIQIFDETKTLVFERPSLPYIVFVKDLDKVSLKECHPFYLFDENGEFKQFVFSNKPLRIEITH